MNRQNHRTPKVRNKAIALKKKSKGSLKINASTKNIPVIDLWKKGQY